MKQFKIIKCIIYTIVTILIIIFRDYLVSELRILVSPLMFAYGAEYVVLSITQNKLQFYKDYEFYQGLIEIILSLVMFFIVTDYITVCSMWAMWSILREVFDIKETVQRIIEFKPAIIGGIESILVIVLSITLLLEPGIKYATTHSYLLCAELLITGFTPIVDMIIDKIKEKKSNKV